MTIKDTFVLQQIDDENIVVPIGPDAERLHGIIKLNEAGVLLWNILSEKNVGVDQLVNELIKEYQIDSSVAKKDVDLFLDEMKELGCIE